MSNSLITVDKGFITMGIGEDSDVELNNDLYLVKTPSKFTDNVWSNISGGKPLDIIPNKYTKIICDGNSGNGILTVDEDCKCRDYDASKFSGGIYIKGNLNITGKLTMPNNFRLSIHSNCYICRKREGLVFDDEYKDKYGEYRYLCELCEEKRKAKRIMIKKRKNRIKKLKRKLRKNR